MIPRYSRPEMSAIWEARTRFRIWFEIEAYACDALAGIGVIPKQAARAIWEKMAQFELGMTILSGAQSKPSIIPGTNVAMIRMVKNARKIGRSIERRICGSRRSGVSGLRFAT